MIDPRGVINGKNTSDQSQQMPFVTRLSSEQMIVWQAQILEMAADQMARLQNLLTVQSSLLQGDIKEAYIKSQEDLAMLPLSPINKEKPMYTSDQVLSGVEPHKVYQLYSEETMTETQVEAMKRQVVEA